MNYLLSFYTPESHLESVKRSLFNVGAGQQGDYMEACWQCFGQGQFRPLKAANPSIGEPGKLTHVTEYKVEILCTSNTIHAAVSALKNAHPYEEPAYSIFKIEDI